MKAIDLIILAEQLASLSPRRPKQAELRRAVSTAYYSLFHAISADAARLLVGGDDRETVRRVYRALDHGAARTACAQIDAQTFPPSLVRVATAFVTLQQARQLADYDPLVRLTRSETIRLIDEAADAIDDLAATSKTLRRRFATLLLFKKR